MQRRPTMAVRTMQPITRMITNITGTSEHESRVRLDHDVEKLITFKAGNVGFHKKSIRRTITQDTGDIFCQTQT